MASTLFLPSNTPTLQQPLHVQPSHKTPNVFPQTESMYQSPPFHQHTPVPWHNTNPFTFTNINGRRKKCAGCQREFADSLGLVFVRLVVQHMKGDLYPNKNGVHRIGSEQASYYHPEQACSKAKSDPVQVSVDMRCARDEQGRRLFTASECLQAQQIRSCFSRLAAAKRANVQNPADLKEKDIQDLESDFEAEQYETKMQQLR